MLLLWPQIKRILISFVLTFVCGFGAILLYLSSYSHTPLASAERCFAYLLAWPLIVREHLGGVDDFMGRNTQADRWAVWTAWIGLLIYYYLLVALWQSLFRKPSEKKVKG